MLKPYQVTWGNANVVHSDPLIETHYDVIFVPLAENTFLDHDREWGIFSRDGQLIDAGAYFRGPQRHLVGQLTRTDQDFDALPWADQPHYVYGGPIINHYGHFILTTLSRFWWLVREELSAPILMHSHGPTERWLDLPYREQIWAPLGVGIPNFATFDRPTRIRKLTIPRAAVEEQNYVHKVMAELGHRVGAGITAGLDISPNDRPVYFTKTSLSSGVTRFANEQVIEDRLRAGGVDIVAPETLDLASQIREFATRRVVIGTSSSAFHTSIFAACRARLICIIPINLLNSNFLLIDRVNQNDARYYFPDAGAEQTNGEGGFLLSSTISNPEGVAERLLRLIDA